MTRVMINPAHLLIEPTSVNPKGGQQVGIVSSGVRVTHLPSGLFARCECERSQLKNRNICLAMIEYGLAELGWKEGTNG